MQFTKEINRDRAQTAKYKTLQWDSFRDLENTGEELDISAPMDNSNDEGTMEQYQFSSNGPQKVVSRPGVRTKKRSGTVVVKKSHGNTLNTGEFYE